MTRRLLSLVLVALSLTAAATACTKGGDNRDKAKASTTTTAGAPPTLQWNMQGLDANGTQPPSEEVLAAVKTTLDEYLARAVVAPLHSGEPAGDLAAVLSPAAAERIAADPAVRATLVDEGMPPATTSIETEIANAMLTSVAGPDGVTALIAARIELIVHAIGPKLDVRIVRNGELVLAPEAEGWRIDSFLLRSQTDTAT